MSTPRLRPTFSRPGWTALAAVSLAGTLLAACSSAPAPHRSAAATTSTAPATTTTAPPPTCPLTGQATPGGGPVPARAALAVKVDNYPDARPQSGLDHADIIFEEPVEGFITRYAAVFQCQDATSVGPIRSARNIDIGLLGQLGSPLEVHVGGIGPVLADINSSPIVNVDMAGAYGSIGSHPAGRVAPYDTYSTTALMWGTHPSLTTPPQPLFTYSAQTPSGAPVSTINIDYSGTSNVTWKWNPALGAFLRYYNGTTPDILSDGVQNAANNVVVQYVSISYGPWLENSSPDSLEVQAVLYPASGAAVIFRNGVAISGTWHRTALGSPTQFVNAAGQTIALQPGRTWVEIVPNTKSAVTTP